MCLCVFVRAMCVCRVRAVRTRQHIQEGLLCEPHGQPRLLGYLHAGHHLLEQLTSDGRVLNSLHTHTHTHTHTSSQPFGTEAYNAYFITQPEAQYGSALVRSVCYVA